MHSRRAFVRTLTAGTFAIGVLTPHVTLSAWAIQRETAGSNDLSHEACPEPGTVTEPPWALIAPLQCGSELGEGWRLADLSSVQAGSFIATLERDDGAQQRVRICRNHGKPAGIVSTNECDLLIMNAGGGAQPTDETLARAVARLATVISGNEHEMKSSAVIAALLTHEERIARFASAGRGYLQ